MYLSLFIFFCLLFLLYQECTIFSSVPRRSSEDAVYNEKKKKKKKKMMMIRSKSQYLPT